VKNKNFGLAAVAYVVQRIMLWFTYMFILGDKLAERRGWFERRSWAA
jgi:hypothetical protein